MASQQPDLLTSREVGELLRVSKNTVYRLVHRGELPEPVRVGGKSFWRRSDVEALLENRGLRRPRRRRTG